MEQAGFGVRESWAWVVAPQAEVPAGLVAGELVEEPRGGGLPAGVVGADLAVGD